MILKILKQKKMYEKVRKRQKLTNLILKKMQKHANKILQKEFL